MKFAAAGKYSSFIMRPEETAAAIESHAVPFGHGWGDQCLHDLNPAASACVGESKN